MFWAPVADQNHPSPSLAWCGLSLENKATEPVGIAGVNVCALI